MMPRRILILLAVFAAAMGLLESAVVVYMRRLYYPEDPLTIFPMKFLEKYDTLVELSREAATIIMLLSVAILVERTSLTRAFAAFVYIFGVWDLCYYGWLKLLIDWPRSWWEWDVLFLIPMVWLGPWICPALISVLFIGWGYWTLRTMESITFSWSSLSIFILGSTLGLLSFFQPAMAVLASGGITSLSTYTPDKFWWWLYLLSYALMAWGLGMTMRKPDCSPPGKPPL